MLFADVIDWITGHADDAFATLDFDVTVEDGGGLSENTGVYVHVGTADPLATSTNAAADADQEWPNATVATRTETGSVVLSIHAVDGGGDQKRVRDQVVAAGRALLQMIRRDVRMDVEGIVKTSTGDINFDQGPTDNGVEALLVIHVRYDARIQGGLA
jgi:hypothetical protein